MWYHVQNVQDAAICYPEPRTHPQIKNHIAFMKGAAVKVSSPSGSDGSSQKLQQPQQRAILSHDQEERLSSLCPKVCPAVAIEGHSLNTRLTFDTERSSRRFLSVDSATQISCHTNCGRTSQGIAFLSPELHRGMKHEFVVRFDKKPGRMCYFIGLVRQPLDVEASQVEIRKKAVSMETLYAYPHVEAAATVKAPPCFHCGSSVTVTVDLSLASGGSIHFAVDTSGVSWKAKLPASSGDTWTPFVSLYNRGAQATLMSSRVL